MSEEQPVKIEIVCESSRERMVTALATNGYPVWVEEEEVEDMSVTEGIRYYVCFLQKKVKT